MHALVHTVLLTLPLAAAGCVLPMMGSQPGSAQGAPAPATPPGPSTLVEPNLAGGAAAPSPATPQTVSVDLKNECGETVRVFYGDKPKFGSGTYSTLSSNSRTSKSMQPGDMIWLVDDADNGIGSVTIGSARSENVTVDCGTIASR